MTDNNALNYRSGTDTDRNDAIEKLSTTSGKNFFERKTTTDSEHVADNESTREHKERRNDDNITIQDFKEFKERERDTSTTHADHSSNKRRRKNSSNCDNSLISTYNTSIQERHYSQDSQVICRIVHKILNFQNIFMQLMHFFIVIDFFCIRCHLRFLAAQKFRSSLNAVFNFIL